MGGANAEFIRRVKGAANAIAGREQGPKPRQVRVVRSVAVIDNGNVVGSASHPLAPDTAAIVSAAGVPTGPDTTAPTAPATSTGVDSAAAHTPARQPARTPARRPATQNVDGTNVTHRRRSPATTVHTDNQDRQQVPWTAIAVGGGSVLLAAAYLLKGGAGAPVASPTGSFEPSGSPSGAPRTDGPSTSPSIAPSTSPSVAPSKEPSASPSSENLFPTTREAVVASLGGNINPDFVMRGYSNGKADGTWQIETFPLLAGVHADGNGDYVDANGNVLTDRAKIYDFSAKPQWINSLTLTVPGAYLFARSGGDVPSGQQANRSRFDGTINSTITGAFEQAALIPTEDCNPTDAAWRDAVNNFTWNSDVQKGIVKVDWFNPETNQLQQIDGRMVTAYAKAGIDIASLIQEMPANYPITPDQAASDTGGGTKAANWTLDAKTANWGYEGFEFASGISYDAKRGVHTDSKGNVITDLAKIYNYNRYDVSTWPTSMTAANIPNTYTFMRTGGASGDRPNTSWYGFGKAEVKLNKPGFEQAAIVLIPATPGCTSIEAVAKVMAPDVILAARNTAITVEAWTGQDWVNVPAAAAASASLPN
jgi:hypothetical protein